MNKLIILLTVCVLSVGVAWVYVMSSTEKEELTQEYKARCRPTPRLHKDRMHCGWLKFIITK
jgi:hypothetical protein